MESKEDDVVPATEAGQRSTSVEAQDAEEQFRLEEKKLVRKIDWILMPILTITLGLQVSIRTFPKIVG
jgi:hypothetical protein